MANYFKQTINLPTKDPKSQHIVKDIYDEQRLLEFLEEQSSGFADVVIIDPYWEIDSMKIVHNIIRHYSSSIFRNLIILKCKKQNDNNDTSKIEIYKDENRDELENIRIFDTQTKDSFHNRYLVFGYIEKEQEIKKMVSERVFVLSDSLCSITKPAKAKNLFDRRRELDIAYQSDFGNVRKTVEGLFEIYVGKKI
jgi:hypothetical protein